MHVFNNWVGGQLLSQAIIIQCILGYPNLDYPDPRLSGRQRINEDENGKIKVVEMQALWDEP